MIPLDKFKMGYFILYRSDGSLFSNTIKKRQILAGFKPSNAAYTHIEVSGGERHSINISPPISKLIDITEKHRTKYVRLMRFKNQEYEDKKRYKVAYFSASLCNKSYDVLGILAFVFRWIKQNNRLYFCSEGASWALQMVFPGALKITPDKCMPAHFLGPEFEEVWEGVIDE